MLVMQHGDCADVVGVMQHDDGTALVGMMQQGDDAAVVGVMQPCCWCSPGGDTYSKCLRWSSGNACHTSGSF